MQGYVLGALRKELLIASFVEPLKQLLSESLTANIYQYFEQKWLSIAFSPNFFQTESYESCSTKVALRKKVFIASFVKRFNTGTLGKSYWYILPVLGTIYLNIPFLLNFCW